MGSDDGSDDDEESRRIRDRMRPKKRKIDGDDLDLQLDKM